VWVLLVVAGGEKLSEMESLPDYLIHRESLFFITMPLEVVSIGGGKRLDQKVEIL
jgi:hypothetical protein